MTEIAISYSNKKKKMIKNFGELMAVLCMYAIISVVQAFWGLFCNYLIHDQHEVFKQITPLEIVIAWGSCIVHQMILAMFVFCSLLPMMSFPWSAEKLYGDEEYINLIRARILFCAMIPLCLSYVCIYIIEVKLMNVDNPPSAWTSAGSLYALSGYVKALPFCIIIAYLEIQEDRKSEQVNVYDEEQISDVERNPKTLRNPTPKPKTNSTDNFDRVTVITPKILGDSTQTETDNVV